MKTKMTTIKAVKMLVMLCIMMCATGVSAQPNNRAYIKGMIDQWGRCRNVALTQTNGNLALYDNNGWAMKGCPQNLQETINQLNAEQEYIDDVQLTEQGRWVILYGKNGALWNNIPKSLEDKIREFNANDETITTITMNDADEWIVVTTAHISSSDDSISQWLVAGVEQYGQLWTACMTDDGCVAVFENGYDSIGDIPETLQHALQNTELNVYRLKIAGDAWFFADKEQRYQYWM